MSIANKLTYLNTTKQKIKDGINALGGGLTNESTFRSYANVLNDLYEAFPKVESTDTDQPITLENTAKGKLKLDYKGNTSQASDPTPDSPVDVNVVSGDNTIEVCGKNLFDSTKGENGFVNDSGGVTSRTYQFASDYIPISSNNTYTISLNTTASNIGTAYFDSNKGYLTRSDQTNRSSHTFTPNSNWKYIRFWVNVDGVTSVNATNIANTYNVQLEKSNSATSYEAYTGQSQLISLGVENYIDKNNPMFTNMPLQSDGTVWGTSSVSNVTQYIKVLPNTEYILTLTNDSNTRRIAYYKQPLTTEAVDSSKIISVADYSGNSKTFTTPNGCHYIRLSYYNSSNNIKLVKTNENANPIELCKISTYQDFIRKGTGKNLFDGEVEQGGINTANGTKTTNTNRIRTDSIIYLEAGTYTINASGVNNVNKHTYSANGTWESALLNWQTLPYTFTLTSKKGVRFVFRESNDSDITPSTISEVQLEKGSTSSEYEPYGKVWYLHKEIGKVVLDGSENFGTQNNVFTLDFNDILTQTYSERSLIVLSDFFKGQITNYRGSIEDLHIAKTIDNAKPKQIAIRYNALNNEIQDFKTWLSTHNTIVYYPLATPTNTEITDTTLISQLENTLYSYTGQTNISQENNDKPFIIKAVALRGIE